jgi:hypothetical protein
MEVVRRKKKAEGRKGCSLNGGGVPGTFYVLRSNGALMQDNNAGDIPYCHTLN